MAIYAGYGVPYTSALVTYLHGYGSEEAARLRDQARALEPWVHNERFFAGSKSILEVGCGVGGQTALLLERYPEAKITALELDESNYQACAQFIASDPERSARAQALLGDARRMPSEIGAHDAAFICWVLEHCPDPVSVLTGTRACLSPGGKLVVHEVFSSSWFIGPQSPAVVSDYYQAYNALQRDWGGDPDIGAQLGQLLLDAGYVEIQTSAVLVQVDDRAPLARQGIFDYLGRLLRSAEDGLTRAGKVTTEGAREVERTLREVGRTPGTTFTYSIIRGIAHAPR